jgi:hypothetical protein
VREKNMERFENISIKKNMFVELNLKAKRPNTNINFAKMKEVIRFRYGTRKGNSKRIREFIIYKLGDRIIIERHTITVEYGIFGRELREFFEVVFD